MFNQEMQLRAELLGKVLDTGVHPIVALDHARQLWSFIDGRTIEADSLEADISMLDSVVGISLDGDGRWRQINGAGQDILTTGRVPASYPVYSHIRRVLQDEQECVEIPAFFVRTANDGDARVWMVSHLHLPGFSLHPAFRRPDGSAAPAIRVGAYAAGEMEGYAVVEQHRKPWVSIDFDTASERCRAMGEGWRMWSIYDLSAIQILALIEMGGPDMQDLIGRGRVEGGSALGGGETAASWRGIHELWGNVWQMVDGLRIAADRTITVWNVERPGSGEWVHTGVKYGPGTGDGFPVELHEEYGPNFDLSLLFLPSEVSGDRDDAVIPDWVWGPWGDRECVTYCGGGRSHGAGAGAFALYLDHGRSGVRTLVGFRPAFVL